VAAGKKDVVGDKEGDNNQLVGERKNEKTCVRTRKGGGAFPIRGEERKSRVVGKKGTHYKSILRGHSFLDSEGEETTGRGNPGEGKGTSMPLSKKKRNNPSRRGGG